jgi:hypothetical protein
MPCYRCGTRQTDPDRGQSPWKRGVRGTSQVLICPQCQSGRDWAGELDRCRGCGSVRLVRRLGEVECRDCGQVREAGAPAAGTGGVAVAGVPGEAAAGGPGGAAGGAPGGAGAGPDAGADLAEEVARALERVLGPPRVSS